VLLTLAIISAAGTALAGVAAVISYQAHHDGRADLSPHLTKQGSRSPCQGHIARIRPMRRRCLRIRRRITSLAAAEPGASASSVGSSTAGTHPVG
jgi:hypothetical protein